MKGKFSNKVQIPKKKNQHHWLVIKAQVLIITLRIALFYSCVALSLDSVAENHSFHYLHLSFWVRVTVTCVRLCLESHTILTCCSYSPWCHFDCVVCLKCSVLLSSAATNGAVSIYELILPFILYSLNYVSTFFSLLCLCSIHWVVDRMLDFTFVISSFYSTVAGTWLYGGDVLTS